MIQLSGMLVDYFYWQYVLAPRWLLAFSWNLERALLNIFSVPLMFRTLLAPWHKDVAIFHGGTLSDLGLTILWNIISRLIGLIFRLGLITLWIIAQVGLVVAFIFALPAFYAWPFLVLVGLAASLAILNA